MLSLLPPVVSLLNSLLSTSTFRPDFAGSAFATCCAAPSEKNSPIVLLLPARTVLCCVSNLTDGSTFVFKPRFGRKLVPVLVDTIPLLVCGVALSTRFTRLPAVSYIACGAVPDPPANEKPPTGNCGLISYCCCTLLTATMSS